MTILWLAILGCSAEVSTFPVEGTVTYKGKAIPKEKSISILIFQSKDPKAEH